MCEKDTHYTIIVTKSLMCRIWHNRQTEGTILRKDWPLRKRVDVLHWKYKNVYMLDSC